MDKRLTWFLLGAAGASLFWIAVLALLNHQLMQAFFGFAGY